ncbi:MAG TPA: caspase family protein [Mucilaginibacter sp.]
MKIGTLVLLFSNLLLFATNQLLHAQDFSHAVTLNETFSDNRRGWPVFNQDSIKINVSDNKYRIDYQKFTPWNKKTILPGDIKNCLTGQNAKLTFDLQIIDRNEASTSAVGLTFDNVENLYNLLYIGEENGKIYAAIIPHLNGGFGGKIRDGKAIPFKLGATFHIRIEKTIDNYKILINDAEILSFIHKDKLLFKDLYYTTGKYTISNLLVTTDKPASEQNDIGEDKAFDPGKYHMYILLAGVKNYPDYTPLNSPLLDINSMKNFWMSTSGGAVPEQNIVYLPEKMASRDNIIRQLKILAQKATSSDEIIVYLTGHGTYNGYFNCYDYPIPYSQLHQIITGSKAKNKLVIIDACFSGYIRNIITTPTKGVSPKELNDDFKFNIALADRNTNYLLSCSAEEKSSDGLPNSNSVFTAALLETVADIKNKQTGDIITIAQVFNSLTKYFEKWNKDHANIPFADTYRINGVITKLAPKIVAMHPQLIPPNKNNNLPFVIVQKK